MRSAIRSLPPVAWGVVLAVGLLVGAVLLPGDVAAPERPQRAELADRTLPIAVLRAWDRDRAAAWRAGDVDGLRRLYATGSVAGRVDRAMLRAYLRRGLTVDGLRMQVAAVDVLEAAEKRLVLRVTDRVSGATAVGDGVRRPLPRDGWSTRRLVLVRAGQRWQVARVAGQRRPAASTASTSASANR